MGLGGKVDDGAGFVSRQQPGDQCSVANIPLNESMASVVFYGGQIPQITCIGELIQVNDTLSMGLQPIDNKIRTDKTAPPVTRMVIRLVTHFYNLFGKIAAIGTTLSRTVPTTRTALRVPRAAAVCDPSPKESLRPLQAARQCQGPDRSTEAPCPVPGSNSC